MSLIQRYYQYQRRAKKIKIDNKANNNSSSNNNSKGYDNTNSHHYTNYGSLIEMFQDRVSHYGDKICIRYENQQQLNNNNTFTSSLEFESLTFNQVDIISTYFAEQWAPELTNVSCVAYILDDPVVSFLTILAILKLRRTVFPISTRNSKSAIVHLLAKTQTGYLITTEKYRSIAQECCATRTETMQQEEEVNNSKSSSSSSSNVGLKVLPLFSKDKVLKLAFQCSSINGNKNKNASSFQQEPTTKITTEQQHKNTIIIIHTSGTMTFPKPIYHSNQLLLFIVLDLLGSHFSHANPPLNNMDVVMLTFPLFHGHGIMSIFTILSLGATAVLFRRLPPLARDTLAAIKKYNVTAMTLPPIQIEDLASYIKTHKQDNRNKRAMDYNITKIFQQIKYCTYSGAPLRIEVGDYLHSKGLNVRNAYGSSETGFVGGPDLSKDNKQWYNMNISTSPIIPYIYWEPMNDKKKKNEGKKIFGLSSPSSSPSSSSSSNGIYQLTFKSNYPALGSNVANRPDGGYATGDLFIEDPPHSKTWRHVGRVDDTLVMKNGEKTNPIPMESEINKNPMVKNCMIVGANRECTAALIELAMDEAIKYSPMEIISEVYKSVKQANVMAPSHSTIMIPQMVYILPLNKTLVTTFKGTISRQKTMQCFEEEIEQMYNLFLQISVFNADTTTTTPTPTPTPTTGDSPTPIQENNVDRKQQGNEQEDVKVFLCRAVYQVLNCPMDEIELTTPLFDYGLDSLLAIQLRNIIATRFSCVLSITNFCFEYPTIESMVQMLCTGSTTTTSPTGDPQEDMSDDVVAEENRKRQQEKRYQETQSILHGYFARIESDFPTKAPNPPVVVMNNDNNSGTQEQEQQTVLLTGATGSLGSFLLRSMIESPQIKKIYCLVRSSRSNKDQDNEQPLKDRIMKAFQDRHISPPDHFDTKVQVLPMNLNAPYLGLENETMYKKLQDEVTIIQCCGWLLDFNHTIQHFDRECIQGLYNLVKFAYRGTARQPIHLHVVSSISATASLAQFLQQNQKEQRSISNNNNNSSSNSNYYIVPERASPQDPHVALPMGYAQSKYIVEHMFSYLAEYKNMPCFVERMGQLMGDTDHGAWNTSEHYPLMMVGGASMKMMPDRTCSLPTLDWIPVDSAATAILEIMMHYVSSSSSSSFSPLPLLMADQYYSSTRSPARTTVGRRSVYHHVVNPNHITWSDMLQAMTDCGIQFDVVEPDVWVDELRKHQDNSAYRLLSYFENNWTTSPSSKAHGGNSKMTLWDTEDTIKIAPSLADAPVFDAQLLRKCLSSWSKIGFYV